MSTSITEQFADSLKAELASQQDQWAAFASKALDDSMSLLELNMTAGIHGLRPTCEATICAQSVRRSQCDPV